MAELRCDPEWVAQQLQEFFEEEGGPLGVGEATSPEVLEYFEGILPALILQIWRTVGFDGLAHGRHWITNPLEWAPAVESWLDGVGLPFPPQRWWCITRTPMGSMQLWGEVSGPALMVKSVLGALSPNGSVQPRVADPVMWERIGCSRLLSLTRDSGVCDDATERLLVDEGFERFGSLAANEVFALVPAYCLSGRMEASMLAMEPAVAHVAFLGQSSQPNMRPDMMATFGDFIAGRLADLEVVDPTTGNTIAFHQYALPIRPHSDECVQVVYYTGHAGAPAEQYPAELRQQLARQYEAFSHVTVNNYLKYRTETARAATLKEICDAREEIAKDVTKNLTDLGFSEVEAQNLMGEIVGTLVSMYEPDQILQVTHDFTSTEAAGSRSNSNATILNDVALEAQKNGMGCCYLNMKVVLCDNSALAEKIRQGVATVTSDPPPPTAP